MSFATEIAQARSSGTSKSEAAAPVAAVEAPAEVIAPPEHGSPFMEGLPAGAAPIEAVVKPTVTETQVTAPKVEQPLTAEVKKAPIKIGTEEFQTIEEAVEFAKQLQAASLQDKAYIEGLKAGQEKPAAEQTAKVKAAYETFAERVFEDPAKAAQEFEESIKKAIRDEYNQSVTAQQAAQQAAAAKAANWEAFYKTNTDLSSPETRDVVENYLLNKFMSEGKLKITDTPEKFADLARQHLKIVKDESLPTKELPAGGAPMLGSTEGSTPVATAPESEEKMDFVSQMNKLRKRKT